LNGGDKQYFKGSDKQYFKPGVNGGDKQYFNDSDKQYSKGSDKQCLTWINSTLKVINIISKVINSTSMKVINSTLKEGINGTLNQVINSSSMEVLNSNSTEVINSALKKAIPFEPSVCRMRLLHPHDRNLKPKTRIT
jgi:hypothetical protein